MRIDAQSHVIFEALAYFVGFALYRRQRRRHGDAFDDDARLTLIVAVVLGAAVGSKLLHHLAHPALLLEHWRDPVFLLGGKTIVGALLGGWIAVELTKRVLGIRRSTGDLYALPLAVGIAIGRVGCLLSGVGDGTHGLPTGFFLGVDLGDGIQRHPTQLYEIVFMVFLAAVLTRVRSPASVACPLPPGAAPHHRPRPPGRPPGSDRVSSGVVDSSLGAAPVPASPARRRIAAMGARFRHGLPTWTLREGGAFQLFLGMYLGFRVAVDFLKPAERFGGLSVLQWAALCGLLGVTLLRTRSGGAHELDAGRLERA